VLGRERGLFARRQDLGLCGLCNKEGVLGDFDASADVNGFSSLSHQDHLVDRLFSVFARSLAVFSHTRNDGICRKLTKRVKQCYLFDSACHETTSYQKKLARK
jgi:hypothetical protein